MTHEPFLKLTLNIHNHNIQPLLPLPPLTTTSNTINHYYQLQPLLPPPLPNNHHHHHQPLLSTTTTTTTTTTSRRRRSCRQSHLIVALGNSSRPATQCCHIPTSAHLNAATVNMGRKRQTERKRKRKRKRKREEGREGGMKRTGGELIGITDS